jgi:hypothetical protein
MARNPINLKEAAYAVGRALQITALIALPFSIWAGQIARDEKSAIIIFLVSLLLFWAGYLLTRPRAGI